MVGVRILKLTPWHEVRELIVIHLVNKFSNFGGSVIRLFQESSVFIETEGLFPSSKRTPIMPRPGPFE